MVALAVLPRREAEARKRQADAGREFGRGIDSSGVPSFVAMLTKVRTAKVRHPAPKASTTESASGQPHRMMHTRRTARGIAQVAAAIHGPSPFLMP